MLQNINVTVLLLLLIARNTKSHFPVGEPFPKPRNAHEQPKQKDIHVIQMLNTLNGGGFLLSAIDLKPNITSNFTMHNVTYPIFGSGRIFEVDVASYYDVNDSQDEKLSIPIDKNIKVDIINPIWQNQTSMGVSKFRTYSHMMYWNMSVMGKVKKQFHLLAHELGIFYHGSKLQHFVPSTIASFSIHTVENETTSNSTIRQVQPYDSNIDYSISLDGQYKEIMSSLETLPNKVSGYCWRCVRWNVNERQWDAGNCHVKKVDFNASSITCRCMKANNTRNFSTYTMLLGIELEHEAPAAMILCFAFESISLVSLFIALVILISLRKSINRSCVDQRTSCVLTHINICASLFFLHLVIIVRPLAVSRNMACEIVAILTHYFLLTSGAWMLVEGITIYNLTCAQRIYVGKMRGLRLAIFISVPWVVPALYVGTCALVAMSMGQYMDISRGHALINELQRLTNANETRIPNSSPIHMKYAMCWLNTKMTHAAAVPILAMLLPNLIIGVLVGVRVWKIRQQDCRNVQTQISNQEMSSYSKNQGLATSQSTASLASVQRMHSAPAVASVRAFLTLLPVLGVPWIGTFVGVIPHAESYVKALHLLASSLQGLLVACIVCFLNHNVRVTLMRKIKVKCQCF